MKIEIPDSSIIKIDGEDCIKVWEFYDAPKKLQELSGHGGDEDWIAFVPEKYKDMYIPWLESGSSFGCCAVSEHKVLNGKVYIGAHA